MLWAVEKKSWVLWYLPFEERGSGMDEGTRKGEHANPKTNPLAVVVEPWRERFQLRCPIICKGHYSRVQHKPTNNTELQIDR